MVKKAPDTPIILLTGLEDQKLAMDAIKAGAQDYLLKEELTRSLLIRTTRYAMERGALFWLKGS